MARFLTRYRTTIFLTFMVGSGVFLLTIDSIFNGGFTYAVKTIWLPLGVLVFGITWRYRHDFERTSRSQSRAWIFAVILYPIAVLMSWPYVMAVNAMTASGNSITYEGPVTKKWISGGRFPGHQVVILDHATGKEVTLSFSQSRYNQLSKGDLARETFSIGGLGVPFRWKFKRPVHQNSSPGF